MIRTARLALWLTLGLGIAVVPRTLAAQRAPRLVVVEDSTVIQEVDLRDGSRLIGRIVRVEGDTVGFRTLAGVDIALLRRDVTGARVIRGEVVRDEFWPEDPSSSRLFLGPTARVPGHGRGYFGVYELVVPSAAVGIGDRFMISGGASIVPGVSLSDQVFFIAPKIQLIRTKPAQVAAGVMWVQPGSEEGVGLLFSSVTAGSAEAAFTGMVGIPFAVEQGGESDPLFMLGGEIRASRGVKLISENWILPAYDGVEGILSLGVRIIVNRVTIEAAGFTNQSFEAVFPLVSFSVGW